MLTLPPIQPKVEVCSWSLMQVSWKIFPGATSMAIMVSLSLFSFLKQPTAALAQSMGRVQVAYSLPPISIQHLQTLTDATGIHEFAHGTIPWHENGYCAEDVGRALATVTLYEQVTGKTDGRPLARVYLAYLEQSLRYDGEIWNREHQTLASGDA
jgi:hypothetical protein